MSKKILLVEDEALIAMHEANMLKKHGYDVLTAFSGEMAIETVKADPGISLILMDIDLGKGMDGPEAAEKILVSHDLPIAFLSSHTEPEVVEKTEGITSYGYIVKNSGETVLITSIKMAFRLYDAHMELKRQKENLNTALIKNEQTAEELETKNEELERYFSSSLDMLCITDTNGRFIRMNPEWEKVLGYPATELEGRSFLDFVHHEDLESSLELLSRLDAQEEELSFENRLRCRDGSYRWIEWCSRLIGSVMYAAARDITGRKMAETEIIAREENLRITLKSIGDAVISTDLDGKVVRMNPVAERLSGWDIESARGKKLREIFHIVNASTGTIVDNPVDKVLKNGELAGLANHTVLISRDGTRYQIADSAAPIKDDNGQLTGVVLVFRDVTTEYEHQKQMEERLKELHCLYQISTIVAEKDITLDEILQKTAETVPSSWQYPEISVCRITLQNRKYNSKAFKESKWKLSSNLLVEGEVLGKIEIYYVKEKPAIDEGPFLKEERTLIDAIAERLAIIIEKKQLEEKLLSIEWMLSTKTTKQDEFISAYGDLTELNKDGLIFHSVRKEQLKDIASEYLDLLETSTAIYEKNGDYAFGLFSSGWCRLMDSASRRLCNTGDNREALESGKWLCHESCWKDAALAMKEDRPVEIKCNGGISMYAVPVHANGETVGAINFGFGSPPTEEAELEALSQTYHIPIGELREQATAYKPRPQFLIDYAKERIHIAAKNLGNTIEREQQKTELEQERLFLASVLDNIEEAIIICDKSGRISRFNDAARRLHGLPEKPVPSDHWSNYYDLYTADGTHPLPEIDIPLFRAFQGENVKNAEIVVKPENSRPRLLTCNGHQLLDSSGNKIGAVIAMHDITEYREAANNLHNLLKEKDFLMKELNHRVKNNLTMVSSLISLKDLEIEADLSGLNYQTRAIGLIHEKLYQSEKVSQIHCREYISDLITTIFSSFTSRDVEIEKDIDDMYIPAKTAISLGLIINEITTNAIKHGFSDQEKAVFSIKMAKNRERKRYELTLSNSGNPFPEEIEPGKSDTLGLHLINTLIAQLKGTMELQKRPHPVFTISFPIEEEYDVLVRD
jgi:PAS domain S-box-containing protein